MPPPREGCSQKVLMTEGLGEGGLWVRFTPQSSEDGTLLHPRVREGTEKWDEAWIPKHGAVGLEKMPRVWSQATPLAW